jgi:hypothetical protein
MRCRIAVAVVLAGLSAPFLSAQVPAGGEFQVNTYTTNYQVAGSRAVASDADGGFVVVWMSNEQDGSGIGVYGQRYDATGAPLGSEFAVNSYTTNDQSGPSVASDPVGNVVVTWESDGQDGSADGVFAQRFDASGQRRGAEFRVNSQTTGWQNDPAAAMDAAGNFVVAWSSYPGGVGEFILARRYDAFGVPRGSELQVNSSASQTQRDLTQMASDAAGNFVVAWSSEDQDGSWSGIFARRLDASGTPRGAEFQVNTYTTSEQTYPAISFDADGSFVVAWQSNGQDGSGYGVFAQRYDASGAPLGSEFQVNTYTTNNQYAPSIASDAAGNFVVSWFSDGQDGSSYGVFAQRYDASGALRGSEFQVNTTTLGIQGLPSIASDPAGNFVVTWDSGANQDGSSYGVFAQRFGGLEPAALGVDAAVTSQSDGNGVIEPGESVGVSPSWMNLNGATQSFDGVATGVDGPPATGVTYTLVDDAAVYGSVPDGATQQCTDCYQVQVMSTGTRPATHWDATLSELLTPDTLGQVKPWSLHVGQSFTDVPKTSSYYRFVETVLHNGITGGCTASSYCPTSTSSRQQMSIFALVAKEGSLYTPPACGATPMFGDVPVTSPYCKWVEELARRGVVGGCGGGNFCPTGAVTRAQMPIFVLKTLDPSFDPPACGATPMFGDVPVTSAYCKWIEELARRGVVSGCGGGNYCPSSPVNRAQMAVFISATFGLTLYGP